MKKKLLKLCMPILLLFLIGIFKIKKNNLEAEKIILKKYCFADGVWHTDKYSYNYRLNLTGKLPKADDDIIFVVLSNTNDITFENVLDAIFNKKNISNDEEFILAEIKGI